MARRAELLDFGTWSLHTHSRELRIQGQVRDLEPKVFELLLCLIDQRPKVVTLDELLETVWRGVSVSTNVVARSVMKARRALAGAPDGAPGIQTVHRVGYRFVGEPRIVPDAAPDPGPAADTRLGVLPFENATGDRALDWVRLGLAALVEQALEQDPRLTVVPCATLDAALDGEEPSDESSRRQMARLFGLHCVVQTRIVRDAGGFLLLYTCWGRHGSEAQGRLRGRELTRLGQALAETIEHRLFPRAGVAVGLHSSDAFANEALARARQACAEQRWRSAARLYEVVLDEAPGALGVAAQHLAVLAALYDPAVFETGDRLLARLRDLGDDRLAAEVHQALGQAWLNLRGPSVQADQHMQQALELAQRHGRADWVLRVVLTRARYEHLTGRDDRARALFGQAAALCAETGNRLEMARIANNLAVLAAMKGDLRRALRSVEEAHRLSLELRRDSNIAASGGNLALVCADLGLMRRAVSQCDALASRIPLMQDATMAGRVTVSMCHIYAQMWARDKTGGLVRALEGLAVGERPQLQPFLTMSRALHALAGGEPVPAAAQVARAIDEVRGHGDDRMADQWLAVRLQCELRAGDREAVTRALQGLRAHPAYGRDARLQGLEAWALGALDWWHGEAEAAREHLARAVQHLPEGHTHAMARLDLAWVELALGRPLPAHRVLRDHAAWLDEHPSGWYLQARLNAADGASEAAASLLRALRQCMPEAAAQGCGPMLEPGDSRHPAQALPPRRSRLPSCL